MKSYLRPGLSILFVMLLASTSFAQQVGYTRHTLRSVNGCCGGCKAPCGTKAAPCGTKSAPCGTKSATCGAKAACHKGCGGGCPQLLPCLFSKLDQALQRLLHCGPCATPCTTRHHGCDAGGKYYSAPETAMEGTPTNPFVDDPPQPPVEARRFPYRQMKHSEGIRRSRLPSRHRVESSRPLKSAGVPTPAVRPREDRVRSTVRSVSAAIGTGPEAKTAKGNSLRR